MSLPDFVRPTSTAVSGRLISRGRDGDPTVPVVLEAHLLPALIGSSVYVLAGVGPSDSSWPYFAIGGVVWTGRDELTVLEMGDDQCYFFDLGQTLGCDDEAFGHAAPETPADLIDRTLRVAATALGLEPWNDATVAHAVGACDGYDHFDQFMSLPVSDFPGT